MSMSEKEFVAAVKAEVAKIDPKTAEGFDLEAPPSPGQVPERVVTELREACRHASDYAGAFTDACKAQAEKYGIKPGALKRFVKGLEGDKLDDLEAETDDLQALIAHRGSP